MRMNFFKEMGAYSRDEQTGTYRVHIEKMPEAVEKLTEELFLLQINADYEKAREFVKKYGSPDEDLKLDAERMDSAKIPLGIMLES